MEVWSYCKGTQEPSCNADSQNTPLTTDFTKSDTHSCCSGLTTHSAFIFQPVTFPPSFTAKLHPDLNISLLLLPKVRGKKLPSARPPLLSTSAALTSLRTTPRLDREALLKSCYSTQLRCFLKRRPSPTNHNQLLSAIGPIVAVSCQLMAMCLGGLFTLVLFDMS